MLIVHDKNRDLGQAALAVLLGVTAGLFISGYWLIDLFPADSRQLVTVTLVACTMLTAAYFLGIRRVAAVFKGASQGARLRAVVLGLPLACFLFFAGTSQWQKPGRYIGFWLPWQEFTLTSTDARPGTAIIWINTALGDVSYQSLSTSGWLRQGDRMILQAAPSSSMEWNGQTGERIEIVFESPDAGGDFRIQWGDVEEAIHVGAGKSSYQRAFPIPIAASRGFVIALGLLNFWILAVAAVLSGGRWLAATADRAKPLGNDEDARAGILHDMAILAGLMAVAALLRSFNLGVAFPAVDEYYHLIAADQLLHGASIGSVYARGLWIVTIPVAMALRLFGHEVWAARAVGVFVNVLSLVPLYALCRKISRPAAIATAILYACSPWIVTFARVAREYAYYPLFFYLIVLAMVSLIEAIPEGFMVRRDWRRLIQPRVAVLIIALIAPPVFALRIDWLSTFRTILIAYLVLGVFLLARLDWRARENWPFLGSALIAFGWVGWYFYREQLTKLLFIPRINPVPLYYFFPNPPQQWYYERAALVAAIAIVIAVAGAMIRRRVGIVPLFMAGLFGAYLAVFALFSKTFFHTRHLISTQFWFVVLCGVGLSWFWQWLVGYLPWRRTIAGAIAAIGIALLVLNPTQILLPTLSKDPDMPISEDYLHDMSAVQTYLLAHVENGDALVSTVYGLYATWEGEPAFGKQLRINSGTTREEIAAFVQERSSGWIVIDTIRLDMSALAERSLTTLPQMEYIGSFGDEHVWRWGRRTVASLASAFQSRQWISH